MSKNAAFCSGDLNASSIKWSSSVVISAQFADNTDEELATFYKKHDPRNWADITTEDDHLIELAFKSPEQKAAFFDTLGEGSAISAVSQKIELLAFKMTQLRTFGPDPDAFFNQLTKKIKKEVKDDNKMIAIENELKNLKEVSIARPADAGDPNLTYKQSKEVLAAELEKAPDNYLALNAAHAYRTLVMGTGVGLQQGKTLMQLSFLENTALTMLGTDSVLVSDSVASRFGKQLAPQSLLLSVPKEHLQYLKSIATEQYLKDHGFALDVLANNSSKIVTRHGGEVDVNRYLASITKGYAAVSGLAPAANLGTNFATMQMATTVGRGLSIPWKSLDEVSRDGLLAAGIDEKMFGRFQGKVIETKQGTFLPDFDKMPAKDAKDLKSILLSMAFEAINQPNAHTEAAVQKMLGLMRLNHAAGGTIKGFVGGMTKMLTSFMIQSFINKVPKLFGYGGAQPGYGFLTLSGWMGLASSGAPAVLLGLQWVYLRHLVDTPYEEWESYVDWIQKDPMKKLTRASVLGLPYAVPPVEYLINKVQDPEGTVLWESFGPPGLNAVDEGTSAVVNLAGNLMTALAGDSQPLNQQFDVNPLEALGNVLPKPLPVGAALSAANIDYK